MSDLFDQASAIEAMDRDLRIQAVREAAGQSTVAAVDDDCMDCGDAVGEERRAALPGARRCVECQRAYERKRAGR